MGQLVLGTNGHSAAVAVAGDGVGVGDGDLPWFGIGKYTSYILNDCLIYQLRILITT